MKKLALSLALFGLPSIALAAGFAPQSIFLSKSPVVEGDTVRVYAIFSNASQDKFNGEVTLSESGKEIGAAAVVLSAGATQTAWVAWSPAAGAHTLVAELKTTAGAAVEKKSETFLVQAKPKPQAPGRTSQAAAVESSESIQTSINHLSPQVGGALSPVFGALDGMRQKVADIADEQIAATKPKIASNPLGGAVEGAQTEAPAGADWAWSILYTMYFYILTLVRFVVGSAAVFYPVAAAATLYLSWKMFRRFARPSY